MTSSQPLALTPEETPSEREPKPVQVGMGSISANILSTLLLRIASRLSFVILGFYLGEHFESATLVVLVIEAFYVSELILAPLIGSLSDRYGRKPFLLLAPVMGAGAALIFLFTALLFPTPNTDVIDWNIISLLLLILGGRLLEGGATGVNAPATLGYITDTTVGSEKLRARVMTAFEVATVGGLALAIPFGGTVSQYMGTWGFTVVIALHILNMAAIMLFIKEANFRASSTDAHGSLWESVRMLRIKSIFTFLPAWLAVNALVGCWITLITIMLAYSLPGADLRFPGQLLYGGFSRANATYILGGFGVAFLVGMGIWMLILPHMRRTTIMFIGLGGLAMSIAALLLVNGMAENPSSLLPSQMPLLYALVGVSLLGILLLSGFTPAALTQMAAIAETQPGKRGAVMGLYSVVLGVGQLLGATLGGVFVDFDGFTGLMLFSIILGVLSLISVIYMRLHKDDLVISTTH